MVLGVFLVNGNNRGQADFPPIFCETIVGQWSIGVEQSHVGTRRDPRNNTFLDVCTCRSDRAGSLIRPGDNIVNSECGTGSERQCGIDTSRVAMDCTPASTSAASTTTWKMPINSLMVI